MYGLGHTRWATHGRPTEENAHPHRDGSGRIVVVHNGIIENYLEIKRELVAEGHTFASETDTEVVAHLVQKEWKNDGLEQAVLRAMKRVRGLFALVLLSADDPEKLVTVRNGPPIVVGIGDGEYFVASDVPAILSHTRNVVFLDDREMAVVTAQGVKFMTLDGKTVERKPTRVTWDPISAEKAGYKHFMLKEIFEQPSAVRETVLGRASLETGQVHLNEMAISDADLKAVDKITLLACGTSWHAALVGKFMIEELAKLPVEVDYGSDTGIATRSSTTSRSPSRSRSRAKPPTRSPPCEKRKGRAPGALRSATSSAAWRRAKPRARSTRMPGPRSAWRRRRPSRRSSSRSISSRSSSPKCAAPCRSPSAANTSAR